MAALKTLYVIIMLAAVSGAKEADRYFLEGRWLKAAEAYEKSLKNAPNAADMLALGDAYFYAGERKKAEKTYRTASSLFDDKNAAVSLLMVRAVKDRDYIEEMLALQGTDREGSRLDRSVGLAYFMRGESDMALYYFERALERDPNDYISYFYTGLAYENRMVFDYALRTYKQCLHINPVYAQALNNLGYANKELRFYTYAIEFYAKAIEIAPENPGYYYNIGNAYTHKGMIDEAFAAYSKAVELDPKFAKAHYNLGKTYARRGDLDRAIGELKLYIKLWGPNLPVQDVPPPSFVKGEIAELENEILESKAGVEPDEKR